ncbi:hypothetical protein QBC45DRAFT_331387, partial [Copromyces sp. CBS 386.78]
KINNITNRESATLIANISSISKSIPIYIIFKTDPIEDFINNDLNDSVRFVRSLTGFSNSELTLN